MKDQDFRVVSPLPFPAAEILRRFFLVQGFQALARRVQEHHEYLQASFFGNPYCFLERIQYKSPIGG